MLTLPDRSATRPQRSRSTKSCSSSPQRPCDSTVEETSTHIHAGVAAVTAYRRATQYDDITIRTGNKHKSKNSGAHEGSHLADARLGRRRSTATRDGKNASSHKKRHNDQQAQMHIRSRLARRPSTTAHGSPTPRVKRVGDFSQASGQDDKEPQSSTQPQESTMVFSARPSIRETQTDDDILNMARDKCLQDFQQHKLHERRSLFFESITKLRSRQGTPSVQKPFVPDTSLPPYNLAMHPDITPFRYDLQSERPEQLSQASVSLPTSKGADLSLAAQSTKKPSKARVLSSSLKGRIKKIFRSGSRQLEGMPPQHVSARHLHLSMTGDDFMSFDTRPLHERFGTVVGPDAFESASRRPSVPSSRAGISRVTSWANSTTTGSRSAMSARAETDRSGSARTLRKRGSFFGRVVQNRLKRASKSDLKDTVKRQGLYDALQNLTQSPQHTSRDGKRDVTSTSTFASLPSQTHIKGAVPVPGHHPVSLRAITPSDQYSEFRAMSPVIEATSPQRAQHTLTHPIPDSSLATSNDKYPESAQPSPEVVKRRVERSDARWQGSLSTANTESISSICYAAPPRMTETSTPLGYGGLPQHIKIKTVQALSPSIYSRATDEDGSKNVTPELPITTVVKITGREVKHYTISPSKTVEQQPIERSILSSAEWRNWIAGELDGLNVPRTTSATANGVGQADTTTSSSSATDASASTDSVTTKSLSHSGKTPVGQHRAKRSHNRHRPRPNSRQSSFMNERYPMVDSSRNSSSHSIQSRRNSRQSQVDMSREAASVADLVKSLRNQSSFNKPAILSSDGLVPSDPTMQKTTVSEIIRKPQSMSELRASFKSNVSKTPRPIDIQRKTPGKINLIADMTLQNIAAGPYAAEASQNRLCRHENTPPPGQHSSGMLPALSSSEWLAGPASKQQIPSARAEVMSERTKASPGQRMATGWLQFRSNQVADEAPAFV